MNVPSNVLPYLIGFFVFGVFFWRALRNYKRLRNPLSKYFMLTGLLATLTFFFWSVPFIFTRDGTALVIVNSIGDFCLYAFFVLQAYLVYYLALRDKFPLAMFMFPPILIAVAGWVANVYGYLEGGIAVVDNKQVYSLPLLSSVAQVVLLVNVFLVGLLLLLKLKDQNNNFSRSTLIGISFLYILSAIGGALNVVLSGAPNDSPLIIGSYLSGFALFVAVIVTVHLLKPKMGSR